MPIIIAFLLGFAFGNNIDKLSEKTYTSILNIILCIIWIGMYIYFLWNPIPNWNILMLVVCLALFVISYVSYD